MANFTNVKMQLWKDLKGWGTTNTINWVDFNPNITRGSSWDQADSYVIDQTTSFDLSGFQNWHEVCVAMYMFENNTWSTTSNTMTIRWEKSTDWWSSYQLMYYYNRTQTVADWAWYAFYSYIGIDWDEIWDDSSHYRVRFLQNGSVQQTINFTTSNTSINSTLRRAGYLWVEWHYLHYTDWSKGNWTWYEHTIAVDTSYSSFVWTDHKWYIWLDDSWINRRIYYVDEYWYKKRTYEAGIWYWWNTSVWTDSKWYMRVPWLVWASYWYWYLCFVWNNWYKYRIMNWPV